MKKKGKSKSGRKQFRSFRHARSAHVLLYLLLLAIMFGLLFIHVKPESLNLDLFSVSDKTIYAPGTVEDQQATEAKKQAAEDAVEDQYTLKKGYTDNRLDLITSIFDSISEVKQDAEKEKKAPSEKSLVKSVKNKLTQDVNESISEGTIEALLHANNEDFSFVRDSVITAVNTVMSSEIPSEKLAEAKGKVAKELKSASVPSKYLSAATEIGKYAVIPNYVFDPKATDAKRQEASDSVQPVQIKQGQVLVEENDLIDREVYRKLELTGLLNNSNLLKPVTGLLLMIGLFIATLVYYFEKQQQELKLKNKSLLLFSIITTLILVIMEVVSLFQKIEYTNIGYLVPIAAGAILFRLLLNERLAILGSIILAICGSMMFNQGVTGTFNYVIGIYYLISSISGILFLGKHNARSKILQAGLFVSFINMIIVLSLLLIQNTALSAVEIGTLMLMGVVSGLAASVLIIGLMPFFETGFGILSTMRLIELSNPNHPLLRKILTETPGTYHHSVMVANLSEAACEAVGANGLLARVGAYYHDLGKTKRPQYFIENQMNMDNPHDKLSPQLSKNIIIAHTTDGANMLRSYKFPQELVDIAEQHHGRSLLKFFYYKAKEKGDQITEEEFRYPGPKPQSKEAAIISVADSVEAAVRSMHNPNPERIEKLVRGIISDKLQDGQFSECDLTFRELDTIAKTLCATLKGIFHSRIEYPEATKKVK
ncbi:HD family phosphohydrolase [Bacillus sp. ISL-51]|uniref:HD family phosphohydrolase n=1 Tax=unclassified Bacillus (in: firmicutes) TaxID=185979 RepID=UPI001BE50AF9|nr:MULTISPECIES: HD family phosphohydrolase [unclassified Bacillus (in: firmicutes)]MBT2574380.1 HD family phosphohydrolase [Bacillus sp. ISL-51]MBT2633197.1 HD family phosphohydrolase [Bacillus sp. ISL-26]